MLVAVLLCCWCGKSSGGGVTATAQHLRAWHQSVYCTRGGAQDDSHMVSFHLIAAAAAAPSTAIRIAVMLDRKDDGAVVFVHCRKVLMVIANKVGPVAARRVVNLKFGLDGCGCGGDGRLLGTDGRINVLVDRIQPIVGALYHHLPIKILLYCATNNILIVLVAG